MRDQVERRLAPVGQLKHPGRQGNLHDQGRAAKSLSVWVAPAEVTPKITIMTNFVELSFHSGYQ